MSWKRKKKAHNPQRFYGICGVSLPDDSAALLAARFLRFLI
jgi:hypothetical protein